MLFASRLSTYRALLFSLVFHLNFGFLLGGEQESSLRNYSKDYLLPDTHPLQPQLKQLFNNPGMFNAPDQLQLAGFQVMERVHRGLMVARHPALKGYLLKKFHNGIAQSDQLTNYMKRISGAKALSQFIARNHLQHITVPKKWLYRLPKKFADPDTKERTYLLITEEIDICSGGSDPFGEVAQRYYTIETDVLRELCFVVYHFRGLDSMLHNMPFTYQNKIAFIDTEKWKIKREGYLRQAMPYLPEDKKAYALSIFQALEDADH